jgi:hypothetical protein
MDGKAVLLILFGERLKGLPANECARCRVGQQLFGCRNDVARAGDPFSDPKTFDQNTSLVMGIVSHRALPRSAGGSAIRLSATDAHGTSLGR